MQIKLFNADNMKPGIPTWEADEVWINLIYADMIYENSNLNWIAKYWYFLNRDGIFIVQTDYHSVAEVKTFLDSRPYAHFLNWLIWKNEFGNFKKDRFRQCHDDILIYVKGKNYLPKGHKYTWHPDRIQIPKVTAGSKGLNPSGRTTKIATSVITDICLTTVSKERVKLNDKTIRWQKPLALMDRLLAPFTDEGDIILDPFMGSGTTGVWCRQNNRQFIGIEKDPEIFALAEQRINGN